MFKSSNKVVMKIVDWMIFRRCGIKVFRWY